LHYLPLYFTDIKTISKFAQMEFKHGEVERGRTLFEGIMSNFPKRLDLWSVYIDMEIRVGDLEVVR
jgi:rRNA biogenesis protein RRP5